MNPVPPERTWMTCKRCHQEYRGVKWSLYCSASCKNMVYQAKKRKADREREGILTDALVRAGMEVISASVHSNPRLIGEHLANAREILEPYVAASLKEKQSR